MFRFMKTTVIAVFFCLLLSSCGSGPSSVSSAAFSDTVSSKNNISEEINPETDSPEKTLAKAREIWEAFQPDFQELLNLLYKNGIQTDSENSVTIDQHTFYKAADKKYASFADVKNLVYHVLSESYGWSYAEESNDGWLFWGDSARFPLFSEINGELYVSPAEAIDNLPTFDEETLTVENADTDRLVIKIEGTDREITKKPVAFIFYFSKEENEWRMKGIEERVLEPGTADKNDMAKARNIWEKIEPNYIEYGRVMNIAVETDGKDTKTVDSQAYFKSAEEKYHSVADIKTLVDCLWSKSQAENKYTKLSLYYKDIDGVLYIAHADGTAFYNFIEDTLSVISLTDTEFVFTIDNLGISGPLNQTFQLVKENGQWRIDKVSDTKVFDFLIPYDVKRADTGFF